MCSKTLSHPTSASQDDLSFLPLNITDPPSVMTTSPDGFDLSGEALFDPQKQPENHPSFLIHGNNSSAADKQGLHSLFDEFNPSYSESTFKDRLNRYAVAHSRAVEMSKYIKARFKTVGEKFQSYGKKEREIANDLKECGSFLQFHYFYTIREIRLAAMCSCKRHLLCPLCAIRRAAKTVQVYMAKYRALTENPLYDLKPYLVTFTVKDGSDLQERFEHLQSSLRKMYEQRRKSLSSKSNRNYPNESNKALGGVGSYEVKIGKNSGVWHPHAHFIWLCDTPPDAHILAQEWFKMTGDSFIVDVTPFTEEKDVSGGFLEVFKYALKYSTMSLEDNWEAFSILQNRRLVSSFGVFYGLQIPEQMTDEISFDELPYIEMVFRYFSGKYNLTQSTNQQGSEQSEQVTSGQPARTSSPFSC